jgi:4-alpha-glucanotransferase
MSEERKQGMESCLSSRGAGVLLHISSLPGKFGSGSLGNEARHFVDFLADCGFSLWQMLPVTPPQGGLSPYQSSSVHAGNPRFISLEPLVESGWLPETAADNEGEAFRQEALESAREGFLANATGEERHLYDEFLAKQNFWLDDFVLFQALHDAYPGQGWWDWPEGLRDREALALAEARAQHREQCDRFRFEQFLFYQQWFEMKRYANERGVSLFGDMPIFVAHDSAEVWANPEMFFLDEQGQPTVVAGVPPDYFSETGQRWGNPLYRWDRMAESGYRFWKERMKTQLSLFDLIRIDHFRGFEAYWEIPAQDDTAMNGHWVKAQGDQLFEQLQAEFDPLPLVAEDLGIITAEVDALREKYGFPGMKILQFAFSGGSDNPYLPFRHERNTLVYTGTHDNDTTLGWYISLDDDTRNQVDEYLGRSVEAMPWPMIRQALASRANLAVLPMQDLLGLDGEHRMNLPGTTEGNWEWRFDWDMVDAQLAGKIRRRIEMYGRQAG